MVFMWHTHVLWQQKRKGRRSWMSYDSWDRNYFLCWWLRVLRICPKSILCWQSCKKHLKWGLPKVRNLESDPTLEEDWLSNQHHYQKYRPRQSFSMHRPCSPNTNTANMSNSYCNFHTWNMAVLKKLFMFSNAILWKCCTNSKRVPNHFVWHCGIWHIFINTS